MSVVFAANVQTGMRVRKHFDRHTNSLPFRTVADVLKQHTAVHILFEDGAKDRNVAPIDVYDVEPRPVQP